MLKRPKLPSGFQGRSFKGKGRRGRRESRTVRALVPLLGPGEGATAVGPPLPAAPSLVPRLHPSPPLVSTAEPSRTDTFRKYRGSACGGQCCPPPLQPRPPAGPGAFVLTWLFGLQSSPACSSLHPVDPAHSCLTLHPFMLACSRAYLFFTGLGTFFFLRVGRFISLCPRPQYFAKSGS